MCGRYALGIRAAFARYQLQQQNMPVDEAPDDEDTRETYNFAPGYYGLVYRANIPEIHAHQRERGDDGEQEKDEVGQNLESPEHQPEETTYKLQAMKWGLVPFWTKRNPDYRGIMKTINARDDSLAENRGMWTSMKKKKRCIVLAQGFYEWLKKNNGKEKIPHFVKRKDEKLMCFAGLWDCVQYEGSDERYYTYTIITTDSNQQLKFLHDRMPVILDNGSEEIRTWLDPKRSEWTEELQSLLKPYQGELEVYPVSKDVGKVGNNSANFVVPLDSSKNKDNIANFFKSHKSPSKGQDASTRDKEKSQFLYSTKIEEDTKEQKHVVTEDEPRTEDNAFMSRLSSPPKHTSIKRKRSEEERSFSPEKSQKVEQPKRQTRSATSNGTAARKVSPLKHGNQKITSFFR